MERRLKALLIAEAANPEWVSVPLVGWSLAKALRDVSSAHIVTQIRNREAFLRAGLVEGRDFTAIDSERLARPLWNLSQKLRMGKGVGWTIQTAISSLGYGYFEKLVWQKFGDRIRAGEWDIVHRITPLTSTANSSLAPRCARAGVPFVLGPLNGGVPWPAGFDAERRREREWLSYIRGVYKLRPSRRRMLSAASAIICGSRHTRSEIPARFQDKTVWLPENAIDPARFNLTASQSVEGPIHAGFVGRLVPYKGADMAVAAMLPLLRSGAMHYHIIGDGPQAAPLRRMVEAEGVSDAVTFHGWKEHGEVQQVLARCQLLVFPSVREFGGGVVLEAMALGVVPVIVDYAGPGELVTAGTGYKVPIARREALIGSLRDTLQQIAADPAQLPAMARAAKGRVMRDFTWQAKAQQVHRVWQAVLAGETPLPEVISRED